MIELLGWSKAWAKFVTDLTLADARSRNEETSTRIARTGAAGDCPGVVGVTCRGESPR
jgi:hypothetical protein